MERARDPVVDSLLADSVLLIIEEKMGMNRPEVREILQRAIAFVKRGSIGSAKERSAKDTPAAMARLRAYRQIVDFVRLRHPDATNGEFSAKLHETESSIVEELQWALNHNIVNENRLKQTIVFFEHVRDAGPTHNSRFLRERRVHESWKRPVH